MGKQIILVTIGEAMTRIVVPMMLAVALVGPTGAQQRKSDLEHAGLLGK